jgi:hypothetical protein
MHRDRAPFLCAAQCITLFVMLAVEAVVPETR